MILNNKLIKWELKPDRLKPVLLKAFTAYCSVRRPIWMRCKQTVHKSNLVAKK
jgi:hypothetical protein